MKRVFHHYKDCEEYTAGLWRPAQAKSKDRLISAAKALMENPQGFIDAMRVVLTKWPNSCEYNLTNASVNHQAWLGHAGTFLATRSPEECTRLAWRTMNKQDQDAANAAADLVIAEWLDSHRSSGIQLSLFDTGGGDA